MNPDPLPGMNPDPQLDALLQRLAAEPVPPVPANLESRVWREIRARRAGREGHGAGDDWLARLLRFWREPRVALAGAAAVVAIGFGMSWPAATDTRAVSTRQALGLGVFSAEAPALPSTLLAPARE